MNFRNFIKTILSLFITLSGFTSIFYLTLNRSEVKKGFFVVNQKLFNKSKPVKDNDNKFWAKEILNGGYILFFRHAERDKFNDVYTFDRIEAASFNNDRGFNGTRFGENEYFKDAVCLSKKGEIQANGMSEIIKFSKLPIGNIISSPICRARQTAEMVFGRYDNLNKALIYMGHFNENEKERENFIKDYLINLSVKENTNTVITAHTNVLTNDMFEKMNSELKVKEGGFYIISNKDNKLELKHTYDNFSSFSKIFFPRVFNKL